MRQQFSDRATMTTATPGHRAHQRWLSPERFSAVVSIALLALLEVLPVQAALLTVTGASAISLTRTFGPLWLIVAAMLLFALARWRLEGRNPAWLTLAALFIGLLVATLFVALSPSAYGDTPGGLFSSGWLNQLQTDATIDAPRFNSLFGIAPFVVYLGWRGLRLGGARPQIEATLRRFAISLAVVMVACLGALAAPSALQPALQGALLTLLALDVFAGLAAAALAHRGGGRATAQADAGAETTRWLLTALGAAAAVIVVAFIIGLALNIRLLSALLGSLRPLGGVLDAALTWLVNGIAYVLWIAFVKTLGAWLFKNSAFYVTPPKQIGALPPQHPHQATLAPPPAGFLIAAGVIVGLVVAAGLIVALYIAVRALLRTMRAGAESEVDEERESLDALGLLRRQARDLLDALRGRGGAAERDPLEPGGARWLYREALRAGATAGMARRPSETADEYSQRLDVALREGAAASEAGALVGGLDALTSAYDDARYGGDDARETGAAPSVVVAARRVTAALGRLRH